MENLQKVKNKDNGDILYLVKGTPSKFIEGEEYVQVKRSEFDKLTHLIKRQSLVFHWRD